MTCYVGWGRGVGSAEVTTAEELDAVLDSITVGPDDLPYSVGIMDRGNPDCPAVLEICVGNPDCSFVFHADTAGGSAWGYEPGVEPGPDFVFDYGGVATDSRPEATRVTVDAARQAAREFVNRGGVRPANLHWDE